MGKYDYLSLSHLVKDAGIKILERYKKIDTFNKRS